MKYTLFLFSISLALNLWSQERKSINFNDEWELYSIPLIELTTIDLTVCDKFDFDSQFNYEYVGLHGKSIDSAIYNEINITRLLRFHYYKNLPQCEPGQIFQMCDGIITPVPGDQKDIIRTGNCGHVIISDNTVDKK